MKSFSELPGASVGDDEEALKKAFRTALKAHHPDLHPDDPDSPARFRDVVAANARLREAKQRAAYDRQLQRERQQFQLTLQRQQRRKRMRTISAVAAVGALIGGYGLFALMPTSTIVEINKDEHAATTSAAVKQTMTIIPAAQRSENVATAIVAATADTVKNDMKNAGEPVKTADAQLAEPTPPLDRGEPRDKHNDAEIPDGASKPNADASAVTGVQVIAGRELAPGPLSNDPNFYRERGIAAYRSGDFLGAIGNFDEAIRLNPDDAQSHNIRGNVWDELGVFEHALADYDDSIRIDPNNPAVFHDRAILWQRKGTLDKALLDLDRAIRFSFSDANLYCDRGLVWYQKGRNERAIADFNQAIKLDPNFAVAYINRGLILHSNREFNVAFADSKTIRVDPSIVDAIRLSNLRR
jgi:tetratricopeptide (TPR) repeat protein